jgi:hypothetical protein
VVWSDATHALADTYGGGVSHQPWTRCAYLGTLGEEQTAAGVYAGSISELE